jgi:hypothetical protein
MSKICLNNNNVNSFIEGYANNKTTCPETNVTLNKLSILLLESGIGIKNKNSGLDRLLKIIIQDLKNLVEESTKSFSSVEKPILLSIIGGEKSFNEIKDFLLKIIKILQDITSKNNLINLKDDIEEPLINAIKDNLMGGKDSEYISTVSSALSSAKKTFSALISSSSQNKSKSTQNNRSQKYKTRATVLFEELIKHVFIIYVSPWGLQIHEKCKNFNDYPDLKKALTSIFKFFLSNTILGYIGKLGAKAIEQLPFDDCFNNYILAINEKIKTYRKCKSNVCKLKDESKICIVNILESKQKNCKLNKLGNSIIKQAIKGSFIAELFIKSEFKNRIDTNLDMSVLLGDIVNYFIYDSPYSGYIPSYLPGIITSYYKSKEDLKDKIISTLNTTVSSYNELNCTLFNLESKIKYYINLIKIVKEVKYDFMKDTIYPYIIEWGIIPLCDYSGIKDVLDQPDLKIDSYKINPTGNFKGDYKINNNIMNINLVSKNNNTISYYYSAEARYYYHNDSTDHKLFYNEIFNDICARLNSINFLYSNYFIKDNKYYINLIPTIKHNNNEYNVSVFFNNIANFLEVTRIKEDEDVNAFLKCLTNKISKNSSNKHQNKSNIYIVKNNYNTKKACLDYINDIALIQEGITIKLESINDSTQKNLYEFKIYSDKKEAPKYIIPKSYLFGNKNVDYITIEKIKSGGSKKYIKNKVIKKNTKSKIIKKNTKSKKILKK